MFCCLQFGKYLDFFLCFEVCENEWYCGGGDAIFKYSIEGESISMFAERSMCGCQASHKMARCPTAACPFHVTDLHSVQVPSTYGAMPAIALLQVSVAILSTCSEVYGYATNHYLCSSTHWLSQQLCIFNKWLKKTPLAVHTVRKVQEQENVFCLFQKDPEAHLSVPPREVYLGYMCALPKLIYTVPR